MEQDIFAAGVRLEPTVSPGERRLSPWPRARIGEEVRRFACRWMESRGQDFASESSTLLKLEFQSRIGNNAQEEKVKDCYLVTGKEVNLA